MNKSKAKKKCRNFCMWIKEYIQSNLSERYCSMFVQMTVANVGLMYWTIVWRYALTKLLTKCYRIKKVKNISFFVRKCSRKVHFRLEFTITDDCSLKSVFLDRFFFCSLWSTLKKASQIQWNENFWRKITKCDMVVDFARAFWWWKFFCMNFQWSSKWTHSKEKIKRKKNVSKSL